MYSSLCSIKIHHGGSFTACPGREYVNGDEVIADYVDTDHFSVHELNYLVKKLGYDKEIMYYHFKIPDECLDFGLRPLGNDKDVIKMISLAGKYKIIDVYIEHTFSNVGTHWLSGLESNVVIEELEDEENVDIVVKPRRCNRLLLEGPSVQENVESCGPSVQENVESCGPNIQENVDVLEENVVQPTVESGQENPGDDECFKNQLDESDMVNDVDVDMSSFKEHFERDDKWLRKCVESGVGDLQINDEVFGIDFDEYDSGDEGSELEGPSRRKKLRRIKISKGDGTKVRSPFYVGKAFLCPKQIKELVKSHVVEARRLLKIVRNEKTRIRVICEGHVPCCWNLQLSYNTRIRSGILDHV